ncbi:hypothetical protein [uncultured Alcanivorax sp.]|jgi:hypothetical protein|uniref:hypothetical protein n=1 Tax=uncultured Alcanivorax sp. TaxID=191215 RepID=UPI002600F854|nr:hypothetical protein [uncultured Alcanivorax sp.]
MSFQHRKRSEKIRSDIDNYLQQGGQIRQIPNGMSGESGAYGRLNCTADDAARARLNGQKARGRQKRGSMQ